MTRPATQPLPDLIGPERVDRVTDGVSVARGFHLGNTIRIDTPEGAVVVDCTGNVENGRKARAALDAEVGPTATKYIVYTHCHGDHVRGAEAFADDTTAAILAHDLLPGLIERDQGCLGHWTLRHRTHQAGRPIDLSAMASADAPSALRLEQSGYLEPTDTFVHDLDLDVGGVTVHLEHTEGETRDHLMAWIPELGVLCPGDLVYASFPNLSTPAVGPRPIQGWMRSLERFIALEPQHLVGSHTQPVSGTAEVRAVLSDYLDALRHVWDESVKLIDAGVPVHRAAREVVLPPRLAASPWLVEHYGTVNWGVRAVYDTLTGWYDFTPASLNPLPREVRDRELVDLAGADAICGRAEAALGRDDYQLALELTDVVIAADTAHARANELQAEACRELARVSTSRNEKGFYRSGEVLAERRVQEGER